MADNDANAGGNGDANQTAGKTNDDGNGNPDKATNKKGGEKAGGEGDDEIVSMKQSELNAIIQARLDRAQKAADEKSKLTKEELLQKERDQALAEVRTANLRDQWIQESGIEYAKAAKLFKVYKDDIETDKDGKPTNLKTVLTTARKEWPEAFGKVQPGSADAGGGNGGDAGAPAGVGMNALIRQKAGRA